MIIKEDAAEIFCAMNISRFDEQKQADLLAHCLNVEKQEEIFKANTGIHIGKSRELLSALILNMWLRNNPLLIPNSDGVKIFMAQTGYDGCIFENDYKGKRFIEFKSSSGKLSKTGGNPKNCQFIFHGPKFDFKAHGLIVMTEIVDGFPFRIFIAHGENVMTRLSNELNKDTQRSSYNKKDRPAVRLFSENQIWSKNGSYQKVDSNDASQKFEYIKNQIRVTGLVEMAREITNDVNVQPGNWIHILNKEDIAILFATLPKAEISVEGALG